MTSCPAADALVRNYALLIIFLGAFAGVCFSCRTLVMLVISYVVYIAILGAPRMVTYYRTCVLYSWFNRQTVLSVQEFSGRPSSIFGLMLPF